MSQLSLCAVSSKAERGRYLRNFPRRALLPYVSFQAGLEQRYLASDLAYLALRHYEGGLSFERVVNEEAHEQAAAPTSLECLEQDPEMVWEMLSCADVSSEVG